ncbi:xanthine dehydrogenase family protein subunit M [Rhodoplanes sp.]|uniref:FAD binding domain-containing protein n=1 Tax=Rhodoplanes sp. TaxID=1968906 RepID=UPI0025DCF535|nr:xanthine dehydrogenase family protein subunit M [Rhodoplanes sp.]
MAQFRVAAPRALDEVFSLLPTYGADAALVAGGTDVLIHIRAGKSSPKLLVLLSKVRDLDSTIQVTGSGVLFGALTRLSDVASHPVIRDRYAALADAAGQIGSEQIRNRGTLCGNIGNASPAADTMPPLYIYDAVVNVVGPNGRRAVPIQSFVTAPGKTSLAQGELIESIFCPCPEDGAGSAYIKLARRNGIDIATVGAAAMILGTGKVRVALGAVGPTPVRALDAEDQLGKGLDDADAFERGIDMVAAATKPITDIRASRDYRLAMVKALTREAIRVSLERRLTTGRVLP